MDKKIIHSLGQLKDFVEVHELQDSHSNIIFNALVTITTATSKVKKEEMEVMVNFNVFDKTGQLTILKHKLDPHSYPTQFYPDYSTFTHVDETYLKIEDTHTRNEKIGKYSVVIFPI